MGFSKDPYNCSMVRQFVRGGWTQTIESQLNPGCLFHDLPTAGTRESRLSAAWSA